MTTETALSVRITVPMAPPSHNALRRTFRNPHAYKDLRNRWQRTIFALVGGPKGAKLRALAEAKTRMRVEIEIRHHGTYDPDNLYSSLKPILDSLTRLNFIADDSEKFLDLAEPRQVRAKFAETEILIRPA